MPITERTLRRWRKDALLSEKHSHMYPEHLRPLIGEFSKRILRLTQEALDQQLLRKEANK